MRRTILVLTVAVITAVMLTLGAGVVLAASKTITCKEGTRTCKGTSDSETIKGTEGKDNIIPYNGDDTVYANGGNDYVHHSYGNDTIEGGSGDDTLRGGFGNDTIKGGPGADLIDCAYLAERGDDANGGYDIAYADSEDTVVDCSETREDTT